jgi:Cof subfamily protein (haloacid dehalogenase superfamily)
LIRLLALDLDGTLIARDGSGAREARDALGRLAEQGIEIAIATGRMVQSATQVLHDMGVVHGYVIALNGAELWPFPTSEEPLWQRAIAADAARRAVEICLGAGAEVQGYVKGQLRILRRTSRTEAYARRTRVTAHLVDVARMAEEPQKLLALLDPRATGPLMELLRLELGPEIACFRSEPDFVEIVPPGVHKGVALQALAERLGLPLSEVAAAGDGENDVEMLQMVGHAFAPTSAAAAVRALGLRLLPPPPELAAALAAEIRP